LAQEHDLGPDALEIEANEFVEKLSSRGGSIKSALMNQSIVAGIGNVYSDEILFQTGLHPASKVNALDEDALRELHKKMHHVLRTASKKGGNGQKAPAGWLLGKRGPDNDCPKCGGKLSKTTINGRTAWFCPKCQTKP
jgi:formamidopyrimidine-DNA glycosylase